MQKKPRAPAPCGERARRAAAAYDEEAEATGWVGPEIAFGLAYEYVRAGQSLLDIGIGTGLGSILFRKAGLRVHGMDISSEMLAACRCKAFTNLTRHDISQVPYPYASESMDHVICLGVLQFFNDLSPVFGECARILRKGGLFVFVVGDRGENESPEIVVGPEHTKTGKCMTMYRHSRGQIDTWAREGGFALVRSLPFQVYMDRDRSGSFPCKVYLMVKPATATSAAPETGRHRESS